MYKIISMLFFTVSVMFEQVAVAAPIVAPGSTYSVYMEGSATQEVLFAAPTFDGFGQSTVWRGMGLVLTESETDLGNGRWHISVRISATAELFQTLGESVYSGVGTFGDGLNFLLPVALYDARISFLDSSNTLLVDSGNLVEYVEHNNPWDGLFPTADNVFGTENIGGIGATAISFDFMVIDQAYAVPEPAGALLSGLGLLAMLGAHNRRKNLLIANDGCFGATNDSR